MSLKGLEILGNQNLQLHARINRTNKLIREYCRFKCLEDMINCENEYCIIKKLTKSLNEV